MAIERNGNWCMRERKGRDQAFGIMHVQCLDNSSGLAAIIWTRSSPLWDPSMRSAVVRDLGSGI
jgi:hypothetical protein